MKEYYPDGTLKIESETHDGKQDGLMLSYYENGALESEGYWEKGVANGKVVTYYPNGKKKIETTNRNGNSDGLYKGYSEEGRLIYIANYCEGKLCGDEVFYYYENGVLAKLNRYDGKGEQIYAARYDTTGERVQSYFLPNIPIKKAEVRLREEHTFMIEFAEPLKGKAYAVVGKADKYGKGLVSVTDTLYSEDNRRFVYRTIPQKLGMEYFGAVIRHFPPADDSIFVDGSFISHAYKVVQ